MVVVVVVLLLLIEICSGRCGGARSPCPDQVPSNLCLDHDHRKAHHHRHHQQVDDHGVMAAMVLVLVVSVDRH